MNTVVFDAGPLISLSSTCNIKALYFLKGNSSARFVATPGVYEEVVGRPSHIKKYEFSAIRIKRTFMEGVVEVEEFGGMNRETEELLGLGNKLFYVAGKPLQMIHLGEAECLALMIKNNTNYLVVDEKTLRLLIEDPFKLLAVLKNEYVKGIEVDKENLRKWREKTRGMFMVRSVELVAEAAKKGFFEDFGEEAGRAFKAAVYALRNAGCSLTEKEVREYEKGLV